jgi:hypothetical protein
MIDGCAYDAYGGQESGWENSHGHESSFSLTRQAQTNHYDRRISIGSDHQPIVLIGTKARSPNISVGQWESASLQVRTAVRGESGIFRLLFREENRPPAGRRPAAAAERAERPGMWHVAGWLLVCAASSQSTLCLLVPLTCAAVECEVWRATAAGNTKRSCSCAHLRTRMAPCSAPRLRTSCTLGPSPRRRSQAAGTA